MSYKILIVGALGGIARSLIPLICKSDFAGKKIILRLFSNEGSIEKLIALKMELEEANAEIYKHLSQSIEKYINTIPKTAKILVVSNPVNSLCSIIAKYAPSFPKRNIFGFCRLDVNRTRHFLGLKLKIHPNLIKNVFCLGNHSTKTLFPYFKNATYQGKEGVLKIEDLIKDNGLEDWSRTTLIEKVRKRGVEIGEKCDGKKYSTISASFGIISCLKDFMFGTRADLISNYAVYCEGYYGIKKQIYFQFPVKMGKNGEFTVVKGIEFDETEKNRLSLSENEIIYEKKIAFKIAENISLKNEKPLRICITGGTGKIGYELIPLLCNIKSEKLVIKFSCRKSSMGTLQAVKLQIEDSVYQNDVEVEIYDNEDAFKDVDFIVMIASVRFKGSQLMDRSEMLKDNLKIIYSKHGAMIEKYTPHTAKILVVANPVNSICYMLTKYAPSFPKENILGFNTIDMNRTKVFLGEKIGIASRKIRNVCGLGNHSKTVVPYIKSGYYVQKLSKKAKEKILVDSVIKERNLQEWIKGEFLEKIRGRAFEIGNLSKGLDYSCISVANGIILNLNQLIYGTKKDWACFSVYLKKKTYGIEKDIFYCFPLHIVFGKWKIVENLEFDDYEKKMMKISEEELKKERKNAMKIEGL